MKKVYVPNPKKNINQINPWNKFYKTLLQNDFWWRNR